jgi:hypothetical protein
MSTLRNYFWWTYERGSFHYDVMVTLILAFLFVAPHYINFRDRPVPDISLQPNQVLIKQGPANTLLYEVRAADLHGANTDADRRARLSELLTPIIGPNTIATLTPVTDDHHAIVAYDATISR